MGVSKRRAEMLCILYCDIARSTPLGVGAMIIGQEAAHLDRVDRFIAIWKQAAREVGGSSFCKNTGDGILATFPGARGALEAVLQACRWLAADADCKALEMRVGLHCGDVRVQEDGDIAGTNAALGERVMRAAEPGQVLVSEAYAAQVRPYLPPEHDLRDQGERLLAGFHTPIRLYQLCAPGWRTDFPLPSSAALPPAFLPVALDGFVGRKRERAALHGYLLGQNERCVTLIGTGGCGKTRLALQVAHEMQPDFPDGVAFVALEETTTTGGVLARIVKALSLSLNPNAEILPALQTALAGRRLLLVLDNFEQVLCAAGAVATLLTTLPNLRVLATSREPLQLRGERVYDLDPLDIPAPNASLRAIKASDSVRLFVERVQAANRHFELTSANASDVAALCRAVSGLPLALEIVAAEARYRALSRLRAEIAAELLDIEARMQDVPDRQRTLRAAFDLSYKTLGEADRTLFMQLGLFETAFGPNEVYDVCTGPDLEGGLRRLQDKSLVCCDGVERNRPYRLLIPVREYARDRLGRPEGAVRQRFIAAFTRRAQSLRDAYYKNAEPEALAGIQADLDNFRVAWNMACEDDAPGTIADLGMAVTFFTPFLSRATNIEVWLEDTERALRRMEDRRRLGKLYNARARLANIRGAFVEAVSCQRKALDYLSETGNLAEVADVHSTLAWLALRAQDYVTAERHARFGLELGQQAGETEPQAVALCVLATVLTPQDLEEATQMAERSLELFRAQGERVGMAHASIALAGIAEARGDLATAEVCFRNALSFCWELRMEVQVARCLESIAKFYARLGNQTLATVLLTAAARAQKALGLPETACLALPGVCERGAADETPALAVVVEGVLSAPKTFQ